MDIGDVLRRQSCDMLVVVDCSAGSMILQLQCLNWMNHIDLATTIKIMMVRGMVEKKRANRMIE